MTDPILNQNLSAGLAVKEPSLNGASNAPSAEDLKDQFSQPAFEKNGEKDSLAKELSSPETLELSKTETKADESKPGDIFENIYNYVRDKFPLHFAILTSASHLVSAFLGIKNFDSKAREFMDKFSLNFSRTVLTINSMLAAKESLLGKDGVSGSKNRIWEAVARFIEPFFLFLVDLEDLGLARGVGLGLSQLDVSHEGIIKNIGDGIAKKLGLKSVDRTVQEDFIWNSYSFQRIFTEMIEGGLGAGRRFLTNFTFENVIKSAKDMFKDFKLIKSGAKLLNFLFNFVFVPKKSGSSFGEFLDASGLSKFKKLCEADDKIDKGHTTALSGYLMILGGALGFLGRGAKGWAYKVGGLLRNLGGMVADIGLFGHPDPNMNISAAFLSVNTFMDIFQRWFSSKRIINPYANISMAAYNIGVAIYLNRSKEKSDENIESYDSGPKEKIVKKLINAGVNLRQR